MASNINSGNSGAYSRLSEDSDSGSISSYHRDEDSTSEDDSPLQGTRAKKLSGASVGSYDPQKIEDPNSPLAVIADLVEDATAKYLAIDVDRTPLAIKYLMAHGNVEKQAEILNQFKNEYQLTKKEIKQEIRTAVHQLREGLTHAVSGSRDQQQEAADIGKKSIKKGFFGLQESAFSKFYKDTHGLHIKRDVDIKTYVIVGAIFGLAVGCIALGIAGAPFDGGISLAIGIGFAVFLFGMGTSYLGLKKWEGMQRNAPRNEAIKNFEPNIAALRDATAQLNTIKAATPPEEMKLDTRTLKDLEKRIQTLSEANTLGGVSDKMDDQELEAFAKKQAQHQKAIEKLKTDIAAFESNPFITEAQALAREQQEQIQKVAKDLEASIKADNSAPPKYSPTDKKAVQNFISTLRAVSGGAPNNDIIYPTNEQLITFLQTHANGDTDQLLARIVAADRKMRQKGMRGPNFDITKEKDPDYKDNPEKWLARLGEILNTHAPVSPAPVPTLTPEEQRAAIQTWTKGLESLIAADDTDEPEYSEVGKKAVKDFISTLEVASNSPSIDQAYDLLRNFMDTHDAGSTKKLLKRIVTAGEAMETQGVYRESIFNISRENDLQYARNPEKWLARLGQTLNTYAPLPAGATPAVPAATPSVQPSSSTGAASPKKETQLVMWTTEFERIIREYEQRPTIGEDKDKMSLIGMRQFLATLKNVQSDSKNYSIIEKFINDNGGLISLSEKIQTAAPHSTLSFDAKSSSTYEYWKTGIQNLLDRYDPKKEANLAEWSTALRTHHAQANEDQRSALEAFSSSLKDVQREGSEVYPELLRFMNHNGGADALFEKIKNKATINNASRFNANNGEKNDIKLWLRELQAILD